MAKHDVNFRQGGPITGDSGERGNATPGIESIKPNTDGERAVAANLDRPPENLRKRTEVLRGEMEGQKYLQDADMRWVLSSGKADGLHDFTPPITEWPLINEWHEWMGDPLNRWYFVLEPNIAVVVQPLNTPARDLLETKYWEFPTPAPANGVNIAMTRRDYALADIREVVWEAVSAPYTQIVGTHGTPQFLDLTLSGENNHILTISIRDDNATMLGHLSGAFALWNAGYLSPAGFFGSTTGAAGNAVRMIDILPGEEDYIFEGTADRELHYITAETFRDFFLASLDNLMGDGDTLAVMWEYLVNPDPMVTDGRRQAIPANGNTEVFVPRLFLTTVHPEWIPLGIPLCKRIGKELLWLDGTLATEGMTQSIRFGENGYTVERIYSLPTTIPISMTSMWFAYGAPPAWSTIMEALDGIVADLAGTQDLVTIPVDPTKGIPLVGMPETSISNTSLGFYNAPALPAHSVMDALTNIIALVNSKGSLGLGTFGVEETVTGVWKFGTHVRRSFDSAFLREAPPDGDFRLVYRNAGRSDTPDDIDWDTYSIYEAVVPGVSVRLEVWGGYLSGTNIISPTSGIGAIAVRSSGNADGQTTLNAYNNYVDATMGAVTLSLTTPSEWNYYQNVDKGPPPLPFPPSSSYMNVHGNSFAWRWYATQQVRGTIDFQEDYVGSFPPISSHPPAEILVASRPWSFVLDGFWADSPNTYYTLNANTIYISPGRALVNGKPIIINTRTIISNLESSARHMNNVTLPTDDATQDMFCQTLADTPGIPGYYYLWLRSDGDFFIGKLPPINDYWNGGPTRYPGSVLYRPDPDEVHGGYSQADYCLTDVIVLWQYMGAPTPSWYFDSVPRVGGHERRLKHRVLPSGGYPPGLQIETIFSADQNTTVPMGAVSIFDNRSAVPGGARLRCPGIPLGVTQKAKVGYTIEFGAAAGERMYARILLSSDNRIYPEIDSTHMSGFSRVIRCATSDILINDCGELDVVVKGSNAGLGVAGDIHRELYREAAGDNLLALYILGFYWDRNGVPSYHV
jgi:hypothetical protein